MNSIPEHQLLTQQLDRLAAQRQIYSDAKKILALQVILSVPAVVVWSLVVMLNPALKVYAAFWGVVVTILDVLIFTPWQRSQREKAAKVQELFDCDVLQLRWRDLKTGRRPDAEAIMESSSKFKCKDPECSTLRDWYPPSVGKLPLHLARLICQRASCWWDAKLRRRYANYIVAVVGLLALTVFLVAVVGGLTVEKLFVVVIAPLMPAFTLGLRDFKEHKEAAAKLDRLKEHVERLWDKAVKGRAAPDELAEGSRELQDEIYDNRRRSPLIFDWLYKRLRRDDEEQMNVGAGVLVDEALRSTK